jgi:hypothetical protein
MSSSVNAGDGDSLAVGVTQVGVDELTKSFAHVADEGGLRGWLLDVAMNVAIKWSLGDSNS